MSFELGILIVGIAAYLIGCWTSIESTRAMRESTKMLDDANGILDQAMALLDADEPSTPGAS